MRLRNDKDAPKKLEESNLLITKSQYPISLKNTDVIEIGMGKGEMITQLAALNPNINFYGLEKFATVAAKSVRRAKEYKLNNFKIILEDAKELESIFKGTCGTIWLTFSDPWPKARHFKRRLTYKDFLEKYKLIMDKNTILKFKSDNDKLYEFSLESFNENQPLSHKNFGWEIFVINLIKYILKKNKNVIFGIWGNDAKRILQIVQNDYKIDENKIIFTSHPSPLAYSKTTNSFKDSKFFIRVNSLLKNPINWDLRKD